MRRSYLAHTASFSYPFVRRAGPPGIPDACNAHDGLVLQVDFERALSVAGILPLEEPAQPKDTSLADDELTIESALEDRPAYSSRNLVLTALSEKFCFFPIFFECRALVFTSSSSEDVTGVLC
jgi:hypothetical protein